MHLNINRLSVNTGGFHFSASSGPRKSTLGMCISGVLGQSVLLRRMLGNWISRPQVGENYRSASHIQGARYLDLEGPRPALGFENP